MQLLDTNIEEVLKKILNSPIEDTGEVDVTLLDDNIINELIDKKYVVGGFARIDCNKNYVCLTNKGENYFEKKKKFLKQKRNLKISEWAKFGISTVISIVALVVSIISLYKKG